MNKETTKMIPGDELHLTMLMAPYSLNLVTGQDRQHLLAFGRAAFDAGQEAGKATPCLHQMAEPAQAARTEFEAVSRFMKCEWILDWDPAGFYDDAKTDTAFTWFEQGYMRAQQASAPQAAVHPDDAAVDALAVLMKAKLAEKRAKGYGGWSDKTQCPQQRLSDMLRAHVLKGDPVDVANFCAMLSARGEGIAAAPQAVQPAEPVYSPNNPAPLRREGESIHDYRVRCGWDHPAHPAEGVPAPDARETVLAHLDGLLDDAAAHIYPSDLRKCQTSECTVTVASVRIGNRIERSMPLFSREQVVEAFDAALAAQAKQGGADHG